MPDLEPVSSYDHHYQDDAPTVTDRLSADNTGSASSGDTSKPLSFFGGGVRATLDSFGLCSLTAGQGRIAGALNFNQRLGLLGKYLRGSGFRDSNLEVTSTLLGLGSNNSNQPGPHSIRYGSTYRKPTNPDIRLDCTLAWNALPLKARVSVAGDNYINCNDLSTQVDTMPLVTPTLEATGHLEAYAENMWLHDHKTEANLGATININRRFDPTQWVKCLLTPYLAPAWLSLGALTVPAAAAFAALMALPARLSAYAPQSVKSASHKLFAPLTQWFNLDLSAMAQCRSIKRTVRHQQLTPTEHKRNVLAPVLDKETWRRFLRRHVDDWILCPDRFDASGKITSWPKRLSASYGQGIRSSEALSPHNIDCLQPGELLSYSNDTIKDLRLTPGIFATLPEGAALHTTAAACAFRSPTVAGAGLEYNYKLKDARSVDYLGTIEEPGVPLVLAKSSTTRSTGHSGGAFGHVVERLINSSHNWQWATQTSVTAESAYPRHLPSLTPGEDASTNPLLTAARYRHLDPLQLGQEPICGEVSEASARDLLTQLRTNAAEASEDLTVLGRDDRFVRLEHVRFSPLYSSVLKSSVAPNGAGIVTEAKNNLTYGTMARAHYDDVAGIRAERDVFIRHSSEVVMPYGLRKELEVRSTIRYADDGSPKIDGVSLALDLKFATGHEDTQVNDVLQSLGKLYKNGRPFHLLPIPQQTTEDHNHPKVVRDVCLQAHLSAERLRRLRDILKTTDAHRAADIRRRAKVFGIAPRDIQMLLDKGLTQDPFNEETTAALGTFICKQSDPTQALQFMQNLCNGTWFAPNGRSGTGTAGRLSKEVADLRNTLEQASTSAPTIEQTTQILAEIEGFKQRIQCAMNGSDVYTSDTFRATDLRLLRAALVVLEKAARPYDTQEVRRHLLSHPLNTTADLLAAQHLKLEADLRAQRKRLADKRKSGHTALRLQEINNKLVQLGVQPAAA